MKLTHIALLAFATLCLGITMPSCPGQEAMQQQVDQLQAKDTDLAKRLAALEANTKASNENIGKMQLLLKEMTDAVTAQKTAIDQLGNEVKELQAKGAAKGGAKAKKRR